MKNLLVYVALLLTTSFAESDFRCFTNHWVRGTGRYSLEGEYSSYWGSYAHAGEYVLFQFHGRGKVYWFHAEECEPLN